MEYVWIRNKDVSSSRAILDIVVVLNDINSGK